MERREFVKSTGAAALAVASGMGSAIASAAEGKKKFKISLAAWSIHKMFFNKEITQLEMPAFCREMGIEGLELVNSFHASPQYEYHKQLRKAAEDNGVKLLLIMCDGEGNMSSPDKKERMLASKNHHKWVDIAAVLGCHSIRCNTNGSREATMDDVKRAAESFSALAEYGKANGINIIIENHGHNFSAHPEKLVELMKMVDSPYFGTLPDFGNFPEDVDRYDAVKQMMPYAKAVSAKCHEFDANGNEVRTDYERMMKIVTDAGYNGFVGIEYEGDKLSERDGIIACKRLLERLQA